MADLLGTWRDAFMENLARPPASGELKGASLLADLRVWTTSLTAVVVSACTSIGWAAAGKGHRLDRLPKAGQEYLGIDVMAFPAESATNCRWPMPLAVFELENAQADDRVAYSLWKVLCLRADLRVVFAYRPDWEQGRQLVSRLADDV
ncbi:MAG TPA: hypothetical protein VGX76_21870, partial [Pirellulales bacterium]|nr:hypothetical protein [Pirellulales bacterium]